MKKLLSFLLCILLISSLCACSEGASAISSPTTTSNPVSDKKPLLNDKNEDITENLIKTDYNSNSSTLESSLTSGILAVFVGNYSFELEKYETFSLVWINPDTGKADVFRTFCAKDAAVEIDPDGKTYYFENNYNRTGKKYLRQSFDSDYSRIIAKNTETNHYGWVDVNGDFTDVTGKIFTDYSIHHDTVGIGFYDDYYYLITASCPADIFNKWKIEGTMDALNPVMESSELKIYRIPIDNIGSSQIEEIPISFHTIAAFVSNYEEATLWDRWTEHTGEIVDGDQHYLIQSDEDEIWAFKYLSSEYVYSPIFYDDMWGLCSLRYEDWLSSSEAIYCADRWIYKTNLIPYDSIKNREPEPQKRNLIVDEIVEKNDDGRVIEEYLHRNAITNQRESLFACIDTHAFYGGIYREDRYIHINDYYDYIAIYDYDGNKMRTLNNILGDEMSTFSVTVDGKELELKSIIDWIP